MDTVEVDTAAWERIEVHALKDYPEECCGLLIQTAEGDAGVHPCENIHIKLH